MDLWNILDRAIFEDLLATMGAEFIPELFNTYLAETPELIAELKQSLLQQDVVTFTRHAHSIKSSSASLGLLSFSIQARELEMLGKDGLLADAGPKVEQLCADFEQVQRVLQEWIHEA